MRLRSYSDAPEPSLDWLYRGARIAIDPWHTVDASLLVRDGTIRAILPGEDAPHSLSRSTQIVDLRGMLVLPGLVNAHDHLQYATFPRLGRGPYTSWREWAADIHATNADEIDKCLETPKHQRIWHGILRNLCAGVTTVCHHDPAHWLLRDLEVPINVHTSFGWAHSLDDLQWKDHYAQTPPDWPFIVHCAEGVDLQSRREISRLERSGMLSDRLALVHAVGVSARDWNRLRSTSVWVIWCPTSNLHILDRTLSIEIAARYQFLVIGSDSPISAAGDFIDELRHAQQLYNLPADLVYRMATTRPARLLRLADHRGSIAQGGRADLLILRDRGQAPCEALLSFPTHELMGVVATGRTVLASDELHFALPGISRSQLSLFERKGRNYYAAIPRTVLEAHVSSSVRQHLTATEVELTKQ